MIRETFIPPEKSICVAKISRTKCQNQKILIWKIENKILYMRLIQVGEQAEDYSNARNTILESSNICNTFVTYYPEV